MGKLKPKTIIINTLNHSKKERLLILTPETILATKEVNVTMIDMDTYYIACKLKRAQVFAISMKDLEY